MSDGLKSYHYSSSKLGHAHGYLLPQVEAILAGLPGKRIFELGCGNGSVAAYLASKGYDMTGIDFSEEGIAQAQKAHPGLKLAQGSVYDDQTGAHGRFPLVMSLEVVEHLYFPRKFARTAYDLLEDGGTAVISTPYHGYWKNLAMAVSGKMDAHYTALWDGGHIKFWSEKTLSQLLVEAGFKNLRFHHAGRIPALAKSMICVAQR